MTHYTTDEFGNASGLDTFKLISKALTQRANTLTNVSQCCAPYSIRIGGHLAIALMSVKLSIKEDTRDRLVAGVTGQMYALLDTGSPLSTAKHCMPAYKLLCFLQRAGNAHYKDLGLSTPFGCSSSGCFISTGIPLSRLPSSVFALHKPLLPSALPSASDPAATADTVLPRPLLEGPANVVLSFMRSLSLGGRFFTMRAAFTCKQICGH